MISPFLVVIPLAWRRAFLRGLIGIAFFGLTGPAVGQVSDSSPDRRRADVRAAAGDSLQEAREWAGARDAYRQARALYRQIGDTAAAAEMKGELGVTYYVDGQLDAARSAFRQAATEARAAGARAEAASNLNNVGLVEWRRGRYDAALTHLRESARIHRSLGNRERVASALNNIANIQEERGRYDDAIENLRKALEINRAHEDTVDIASNLNNIGLAFRSQGRYDDALRYHQRALRHHRAEGAEEGMADAHNNIGIVLEAEERYDRALVHYRKALDVNRRRDDQNGVAANLSNIAAVQAEQGHYREALTTQRDVLKVNRAAGNRPSVAVNLSEIGEIHKKRGEDEKARRSYEKALQLNREIGRRGGVAQNLYDVGDLHLRHQRLAAADSVLRESIRITGTLLRTASGETRRDFLAKEIQRFQALVTARVRADRPAAALRTYERSRARLLAERLADEDATHALPPVDSMQTAVGRDEAAILYANTDTERPILAMVVTRDSIYTREVSTAPIRRAARRHEEALDRLRVKEKMPWLKQRASLLQEAKGVTGALASLVRLYRHDLSAPLHQQLLSAERRRRLGQVLYTVLVDPLEPILTDVDGLVVVPDGALSYLPFEALGDWSGTRLLEQWRVRYAQSLRVLHLLERRSRSDGSGDRRPLLAMGGVEYGAPAGADTTGDRSRRRTGPRTRLGGTAFPPQSGTEGDSTSIYRRLGVGPDRWQNIPGTIEEVSALRDITGTARLLTGANASERTLYRLSDDGRLDDYRALHFATHGLLVPDEPALSALVLAEGGRKDSRRDGTPKEGAEDIVLDGYLSMQEIASLDLNAEFVGLSACRTGLGRIYRGSGAVSLAQAFLQAGAGSAAVSLWSVYDASTSRFMQATYRRAWTSSTSWSEAIAETKRAFVEGHHGERLRAPRFWAPFVHYGRDAGRHRAER